MNIDYIKDKKIRLTLHWRKYKITLKMSTQNQENNEMKTVSWEESDMEVIYDLPKSILDLPAEELTPEEEAEADY